MSKCHRLQHGCPKWGWQRTQRFYFLPRGGVRVEINPKVTWFLPGSDIWKALKTNSGVLKNSCFHSKLVTADATPEACTLKNTTRVNPLHFAKESYKTVKWTCTRTQLIHNFFIVSDFCDAKKERWFYVHWTLSEVLNACCTIRYDYVSKNAFLTLSRSSFQDILQMCTC